jgi:hypothetical protein
MGRHLPPRPRPVLGSVGPGGSSPNLYSGAIIAPRAAQPKLCTKLPSLSTTLRGCPQTPPEAARGSSTAAARRATFSGPPARRAARASPGQVLDCGCWIPGCQRWDEGRIRLNRGFVWWPWGAVGMRGQKYGASQPDPPCRSSTAFHRGRPLLNIFLKINFSRSRSRQCASVENPTIYARTGLSSDGCPVHKSPL